MGKLSDQMIEQALEALRKRGVSDSVIRSFIKDVSQPISSKDFKRSV